MEGLTDILNKLSVQDVEKLRMLFSINSEATQKEIVTLRVFCDEYKNLILSNRSKNYYESVNIALKHLTEYFGLQKSIGSITLKDTELFMIDLQKKVPKGYRVYYRTLKAAFNKAVDWTYIHENHFLKIKLPKKQKAAPVYINSDQLSAISSQLSDGIVKDVVVFAFYTGLRLGEIVSLRWRNVDLENRMITVGDSEFETKGRKVRVVPMCEEALTTILASRNRMRDRHQERTSTLPDGFVFERSLGSARDKFTGDYFSRRFKKACRAAGMDESIHFHSLRHSFASNLAQQGVSLYVIKELLGHSSISTTEIYSHLNMESLRGAVNKLTPPPPKGRRAGPTLPHKEREGAGLGEKTTDKEFSVKGNLRLVINKRGVV